MAGIWGSFLLLACLSRFAGAAEAPGVQADSETLKAYKKIHSAFIDLDKNLYAAPPDQVELGRLLFFDPRLSTNHKMACADCHNPDKAWTDGLSRARGIYGQELPRNTPSLFNINRNIPHLYFLDGRAQDLEEAATTALRGRLEMNRDPEELAGDLRRVPAYVERFEKAFGKDGLSEKNAIHAIASYLKAQIKVDESPFDRFQKDPSAMSASAQRGMGVFTVKGRCMQCHNGPFFSDDFFHNIGLKPSPLFDDAGRYAVTREPKSWRAFRTPPLRNVALTAPYMHDGSLKTLREVVDFYDRGGDVAAGRDPEIRKLDFSEQEKQDLVAFLESLTSPQEKVERPALPPSAPETLEALLALNERRLRRLDASVARDDRDTVRVLADSVRRSVDDLRVFLSTLPAYGYQGDCLVEVERRAWDLADLAQSRKPRKALRWSLDQLQHEARSCPGEGPLAQARDDETPAACSGSPFSVPALARELASLRGKDVRAERMIDKVMWDAIGYFEYAAILKRSDKACDELKGLDKDYAGVVRQADEACRERFHEDMLQSAIIKRSEDFPRICRESLIHSYDYLSMDSKSADEACAIISRRIEDPQGACSELVPKYLSGVKTESCVNIMLRLKPNQDPAECDNLIGQPKDWVGRCHGLAAFNAAYWKKDPSLCGDWALCRAFIGDEKASAGLLAAKIRAEACGDIEARK